MSESISLDNLTFIRNGLEYVVSREYLYLATGTWEAYKVARANNAYLLSVYVRTRSPSDMYVWFTDATSF